MSSLNTNVKMSAITKKYVVAIMEGSDKYNTVEDVPTLYKSKVKNVFNDMLTAEEITQEEHDKYLGLTELEVEGKVTE